MRLRIVINNAPAWTRTGRRRLVKPAYGTRLSSYAWEEIWGEIRKEVSVLFAELGAALGVAARVVMQLLCSLRGHDYILKRQPRRLSLYCPTCGHNTPGWHLDRAEPLASRASAPRFLELVRRRT